MTGIIVVALILGSMYAGKRYYCTFFMALMLGCLYEFYRMFNNSGIKPNKVIGFLTGILFYLTSVWFLTDRPALSLFPFIMATFMLFFISELYNRRTENHIGNIALGIVGIIYVVVPFCFCNQLVFSASGYHPGLLVFLFGVIWLYDSGAYIFGVSLGRHRLFERISPKKSWEGAIFGGIAAVALSPLLWPCIDADSIPIPAARIAMAVLIVCAATFGDLSESVLKRQLGLKDSSNIIPGHGGLLDRFDSFLFAAPALAVGMEIIHYLCT